MKAKNYLELALMAIFMCVCFPSCGGSNDGDDEFEDTDTSTSSRRGVHRLDVHFSRNYIAPEDHSMCFFAFRTTDEETRVYDINGTYIPKRPNAQGVEIPKVGSCSYYTDDDCISFGVTMYIVRRTGDKPLDVTITGYINNKKTRERVFTIPENKLTTIYFNTVSERTDVFRSDNFYDY